MSALLVHDHQVLLGIGTSLEMPSRLDFGGQTSSVRFPCLCSGTLSLPPFCHLAEEAFKETWCSGASQGLFEIWLIWTDPHLLTSGRSLISQSLGLQRVQPVVPTHPAVSPFHLLEEQHVLW